MKMSQELYNTIRDAMRNLYVQRNVDVYTAFFANKALIRKLWDLFYAATFELRNDDNHPYFIRRDAGIVACPSTRPSWHTLNLITEDGRRKRINPHIPGFNVYNEGLNDDHIETALKKIATELGIE